MLSLLIVVGVPIFVITFLIVKVLEGFGLKKPDRRQALEARVKELEGEVAELRRSASASR